MFPWNVQKERFCTWHSHFQCSFQTLSEFSSSPLVANVCTRFEQVHRLDNIRSNINLVYMVMWGIWYKHAILVGLRNSYSCFPVSAQNTNGVVFYMMWNGINRWVPKAVSFSKAWLCHEITVVNSNSVTFFLHWCSTFQKITRNDYKFNIFNRMSSLNSKFA